MEKNQIVTQAFAGETVTVLNGKIPVIVLNDSDVTSYVAAAVNFLNCGCPAVKIVVQSRCSSDYKEVWEEITKFLFKLTDSGTRGYQLSGLPEDRDLNWKSVIFYIRAN